MVRYMQGYCKIEGYLRPWCKGLWYWEIAELKQFAVQNGIDTANMHAEALKQVARLLHKKPWLQNADIVQNALAVQEQRAKLHGARMWHMRCTENNKPK